MAAGSDSRTAPFRTTQSWNGCGPERSTTVPDPQDWRLCLYFPKNAGLLVLEQTQQLVAMGRYTDGSLEDMTDKVQFTSNDESVVEVSRGGLVKALAPGETTIMVRSLGQAVAARIFVVTSAAGVDYPSVPANNYIDRYVFEKLRRTNVVPSDIASDEHFIRRIYLDVLGILPSR